MFITEALVSWPIAWRVISFYSGYNFIRIPQTYMNKHGLTEKCVVSAQLFTLVPSTGTEKAHTSTDYHEHFT